MSDFNQEKYACPKCKHEGQATVYESVDTDLNPEIKARVLNFSLFSFPCPGCGVTLSLPESLLYRDPARKVTFHLFPEEAFVVWRQCCEEDIAMKNDGRSGLIIVPGAAPAEPSAWRTCFGANELVEKILIFDAGLDDRVIEVAKVVLVTQSQEKFEGVMPRLLFAGIDPEGKWLIEAFVEGKADSAGVVAIPPEWAKEAHDQLCSQELFQSLLEEPYISYRKFFMPPEAFK